MVAIKRKLANNNNYGGKRSTGNIKFIVIHYTANDGDTSEANARYFAKNRVNASAHYFVDDDVIYQSVPDDFVAWSVGGKKYPNTRGASFYGKCTNDNSISIELCDTRRNGNYDFTEETLRNAADITGLLMEKYGVPLANVIRHYDVNGKICPKPFVDDEAAWKRFKAGLEDEMIENSTIIIDGKETAVRRILKDGTNFISIRDLAEALGYKIGSKGSIAVLSK